MNVDKEAIRAFKARRARRLDERGFELPEEKPDREDYGTSASGNWGHVGREGLRGGSASGGGSAFRMEKTGNKGDFKGFTSRAKVREEAKSKLKQKRETLKKAKASGNQKKIASAQRAFDRQVEHNKHINMTRKSIRTMKRFDPNASRNILAEKKGRGKIVHERQVDRTKGTKTNMSKTYLGTKKRW